MGSDEILVIDGSFGEGGGQVLRNSLALSMITGQHIRIENIRANRTKPGLRPQHLAGVRGAATICNARVEGDEIGSSVVDFQPGTIRGGDHVIDIKTAVRTLLLQTVLPPLLKADGPSTVRIIGGTDVPWSPPLDHLRNVLLPKIRNMGAKVDVTLEKRGFNPKGGGELIVSVVPGSLKRGEFLASHEFGGGEDGKRGRRICGTVFLGNLPHHIGVRMKKAAEQELIREFGEGTEIALEIEEEKQESEGTMGQGTGITLWSDGIGTSGLGRKGLRAEEVGRDAARELITEIRGGCGVDVHTADQLPVFAPLASVQGEGIRLHYSVREISGHLRSALWVLERFGHSSTTIYQDGFQVML